MYSWLSILMLIYSYPTRCRWQHKIILHVTSLHTSPSHPTTRFYSPDRRWCIFPTRGSRWVVAWPGACSFRLAFIFICRQTCCDFTFVKCEIHETDPSAARRPAPPTGKESNSSHRDLLVCVLVYLKAENYLLITSCCSPVMFAGNLFVKKKSAGSTK